MFPPVNIKTKTSTITDLLTCVQNISNNIPTSRCVTAFSHQWLVIVVGFSLIVSFLCFLRWRHDDRRRRGVSEAWGSAGAGRWLPARTVPGWDELPALQPGGRTNRQVHQTLQKLKTETTSLWNIFLDEMIHAQLFHIFSIQLHKLQLTQLFQ